jgi:hypothetical protein
MSGIFYRVVKPVIYSLKLRPGVTNIIAEFKWDGGGSVNLELVSPTKTYAQDQMKVTDKTSIRADGVVVCKYLRRYELTIPKLSQEEIWTIRLNLEKIYRYQLDVEAS